MANVGTFYPVLGRLIDSGYTLPAGFLAAWDQTNTALAGSGALPLDNNAQAGQKSVQHSFSAVATGTTTKLGIAQFVSGPFPVRAGAAQSISVAGTYAINFALKLANAAANFTWQGFAAFYVVNGATGAIRTTIVALQAIGSSGRTVTTEQTCRTTGLAGFTGTLTAGDYLVLELGIAVVNSSGGNLTPDVTLYSEGLTAIASDNATVTDAQSTVVWSSGTDNVSNGAFFSIQPVVARLELALTSLLQQRGPGAIRLEGSTPRVMQPRAGNVRIVLMRGYDQSLSQTVYWLTAAPDPTAAQYYYKTGSVGPVIDIIQLPWR